jgi:hypothetical protein
VTPGSWALATQFFGIRAVEESGSSHPSVPACEAAAAGAEAADTTRTRSGPCAGQAACVPRCAGQHGISPQSTTPPFPLASAAQLAPPRQQLAAMAGGTITFPDLSALSAMSIMIGADLPELCGRGWNAVSPRSDRWTCERRVGFLVELANVRGVLFGRREAEPRRSPARACERVAGVRDL